MKHETPKGGQEYSCASLRPKTSKIMARPQKNNADYFTHDANMRNDLKIRAIRRKFGVEGYAVWNFLLEVLTETDYFRIEWDAFTIELLAGDFDVTPEKLAEIVEYCTHLDLLQIEDGYLQSRQHQSRLEVLTERRVSERERKVKKQKEEFSAAETPKVESFPQQKPQKTEFSAAEIPHSKVKKSKVKEIKENISLSISPSGEVAKSEEVAETSSAEKERIFQIFFLKNFINPRKEVERFYAHYEAQGWKRAGGLTITDRVALAQSWHSENDNLKRFPDNVATLLREWYEAGTPELRNYLPTDLDNVIANENVLYFRLSMRLKDEIEHNSECFGVIFKRLFPNCTLRYLVLTNP